MVCDNEHVTPIHQGQTLVLYHLFHCVYHFCNLLHSNVITEHKYAMHYWRTNNALLFIYLQYITSVPLCADDLDTGGRIDTF